MKMAMVMNSRMSFIILMILITALLPLVISMRISEIFFYPSETQLKEGEVIPLFANKVLPQANNCEAYSYYELPFCAPGDPITNRAKTFEEIASGDCLTRTRYELKFKVGTVGETLCEKILTKNEVRKFRQAVSNGSEYHMYFDHIVLRGMVGLVMPMGVVNLSPRYYLVKHIDFYPQYYENQVVDISSFSDLDSMVDITEDAEITVRFTYSVFWKDFIIKPKKSVSQNGTALRKQWWSSKENELSRAIFLVLNLLLGLLIIAALIVKCLTARSHAGPKDAKRPSNPWLLAAILGLGVQQLLMMGFSFFFAWAWDYHKLQYPCNLGPVTNVVIIYCLLCTCYGFYDCSHGDNRFILQDNIFYHVLMFMIALAFSHAARLAFGSADLVTTAVFIINHRCSAFDFSMAIELANDLKHRNRAPLNPLSRPRFMTIPAQMFLGGLFPFIAIMGKLDEIYASFLLLKLCGVLSTMLSSYFKAIAMTALMGAAFTTYHLQVRHFNWWWRSVLRGGSTAIFIFAYGIYFYCRITEEISFPELYYFLIYNASLCCIFFVSLGAVGFYASYFTFNFFNRDTRD